MLSNKQFSISKQLNSIKAHLQEIKNDYSPRLLDSLQSIMTFFLGSADGPGILYRFGKQFANYEPLEWAIQLQKLLQHIAPGSPAFAQIQRRNRDPNAQIIIPNAYLPHYIDVNSFDKPKFLSIRLTHSGLSLPPLDAFYLMLAHAIYDTESIAPPVTQFDHLFLDQFYSSLSRNPLLVLLRKNLDYFNIRDKANTHKIVYLLRIFLMDELLIKYEQDHSKNGFGGNLGYEPQRILNQSVDSASSFMSFSKKSIQLKYRIKVHHIHTIYLAVRLTPEFILNDFSKYCQAILEYFPALKPDEFCLQSLIRLWIYGLTAKSDSNIENDVIKMLESANSKQGWFFLKRYAPGEIRPNDNLSYFNIQASISIVKLFERDENWVANSSYLFTLACFFNFLNRSRIYFNELSNSRKSLGESKDNNISLFEKILKLIVVRYNQNLVDILSKIKKMRPEEYNGSLRIVETYQHLIQQYYSEYFKSKDQQKQHIKMQQGFQHLPSDFKFRQIQESDLSNTELSNIATSDPMDRMDTEAKRKLVVFYRKQPRGCWEVPIQYNESILLYYVFFVIAKIIDVFIPGRRSREYPVLNLRFLANPITFFVTIVTILILIHIFR